MLRGPAPAAVAAGAADAVGAEVAAGSGSAAVSFESSPRDWSRQKPSRRGRTCVEDSS